MRRGSLYGVRDHNLETDMKSSLILAGIASTLVFAAAADAQHRGPGGRGSHGPAQALMMLQAADANGDNSITRAEVDALQAEMFDWMDRNGDGVLSSADRSPMHQRLAALREASGEERGRHHGRRGGRSDRLQDRDENGDGQISRDEFLGGEIRMFDRLDTNGDNVITPDELDAAVESGRDRHENRIFWWRD